MSRSDVTMLLRNMLEEDPIETIIWRCFPISNVPRSILIYLKAGGWSRDNLPMRFINTLVYWSR